MSETPVYPPRTLANPPLTSWDILICAIWSRAASLDAIISNLAAQIVDGVTVTVCIDNPGELTYPAKSQKLLDQATGEYVSYIDDDDQVATDFVPVIFEALEVVRPDYVGFRVKYTIDGQRQLPVEHSLRNKGWNVIDLGPKVLERDITQFNPMLREIAQLVPWDEPGWQADYRRANALRSAGRLRIEQFIDQELYYKQDYSAGDFRAGHEPVEAPPSASPLHSGTVYPWLRFI